MDDKLVTKTVKITFLKNLFEYITINVTNVLLSFLLFLPYFVSYFTNDF